jgi:hypothetical protein
LSAGAAAVTLQVSVVGGPIDRIAGINLTQLVAATLVIVGTCALQIFVVCVNDPQPSARRRVRPRLLTATLAIAVTATAFVLAPAPTGCGSVEPAGRRVESESFPSALCDGAPTPTGRGGTQ